MAYIGRGINSGDAVSDHLTGSGATVYTLTYDTTTDGVVLSLDGVVQRNGTDFTILGTQLTFTSAVASPIAIQVIYTGLTLAIGTPGTGTVGVSQLSSTGTASSSTYLRGDNSWATIPATADEITKSSSDPTISTNPAGGVGTIFLNTTSGEMFSLTDATAGANDWTNIGSGAGFIPVRNYTSATGGTITTDGNFKVHTFLSSGTFTPTIGDAGVRDVVEYIVVAGGGGGSGGSASGGGGGAGGMRTSSSFTVSDTGLTVTIGGGGAGNTSPDNNNGTNGVNSVFSSITSAGGGGGAGTGAAPSYAGAGIAGGSGGGGRFAGAGGAGNTPSTSPSQGNAGGASLSSTGRPGGGGGGHSAVGVDGGTVSATGGNGGAGTASSISGSSVTYAGGGAGGGWNSGYGGTGGTGGGGNGGGVAGGTQTAGTVNKGGGGGGNGQSANGAAGGSGVVIIRYQFQA